MLIFCPLIFLGFYKYVILPINNKYNKSGDIQSKYFALEDYYSTYNSASDEKSINTAKQTKAIEPDRINTPHKLNSFSNYVIELSNYKKNNNSFLNFNNIDSKLVGFSPNHDADGDINNLSNEMIYEYNKEQAKQYEEYYSKDASRRSINYKIDLFSIKTIAYIIGVIAVIFIGIILIGSGSIYKFAAGQAVQSAKSAINETADSPSLSARELGIEVRAYNVLNRNFDTKLIEGTECSGDEQVRLLLNNRNSSNVNLYNITVWYVRNNGDMGSKYEMNLNEMVLSGGEIYWCLSYSDFANIQDNSIYYEFPNSKFFAIVDKFSFD